MNNIHSKIKLCELCHIQATCLCFECYMYFCDSCYKFIHDKSTNKDHKKENIDLFTPIDIKCMEHSKNILNLFCIDEKGKIINSFIFIIFINRTLLWNLHL